MTRIGMDDAEGGDPQIFEIAQMIVWMQRI